MGDAATVDVHITDVDVDDVHTIGAFSDDTAVATVSVRDSTLSITGMVVGTATITVFATDNTEQDNAAAVPVTFEVTVNEPPPTETFEVGIGLNQPPSSFIEKGVYHKNVSCESKYNCVSFRSNVVDIWRTKP